MNKKLTNELKILGLSTTEISTYLTLLQRGTSPASVIGKRAGINRCTAKYSLENLCKKNLATTIKKNGTFYFTPENPEKILLLLKTEKEKLTRKENSAKKIVQELKAIQNPNSTMPKVQLFEGVDGIKKMYMDVIKEGKTIYGYSRVDKKNVAPQILDFLNTEYRDLRAKKGNKAFMIYNGEISKEYLKNNNKMNRVTLQIDPSGIEFHSCFHIYGEKIAFYSRDITDLTGVIIENSIIRNDQFQLFSLAWKYLLTLPANKKYKEINTL